MNVSVADLKALRQNQAARRRAITLLWQMRGVPGEVRDDNLFAIIDAARDPEIYPALRRISRIAPVVPLYEGKAATDLASVAPYLVGFGATDQVFDWLWRDGWGAAWGVLFWSLASTEVLRAHLRRLTMVRTETGTRLLFRFYDPRVLATFLPTCDAAQLQEMFGPIQHYLIESRDGAGLSRMGLRAAVPGEAHTTLSIQNHDLVQAAEPASVPAHS